MDKIMLQLRVLSIILIGLLSFNVRAAAPVMHVALGERWLEMFEPHYNAEEKKAFLLGTVFPDIRYLGVIKREETHFTNVTLKQVYEGKTPFQQGMLFHSFVDEYRDKWVHQSAIEKKLVEIPIALRGTFLKLVEDQILHNQGNWSEFRNSLLGISTDEMQFGIPERALTQWHLGLTLYFSTLPSTILTQLSMMDKSILTLDPSTVKLWSTLLPKYAEDKDLQSYVTDLLKAFETKLLAEKKIAVDKKEKHV